MSEETPKAPPSGGLGQPGARAYSSAGNVRPADGRFLGDADGDVPEQDLQAIREEEIRRGVARVARQQAENEAENQKRLEESGYVNPTLNTVDDRDTPAEAPDDSPDNKTEGTVIQDQYTAMEYRELQEAAKDRDGVQGNLPAEELRAALRAYDAEHPEA